MREYEGSTDEGQAEEKKRTMAGWADRHVFYEKSVQDAAEDYKFVSRSLNYSPLTVGEADPGWICFLVAGK